MDRFYQLEVPPHIEKTLGLSKDWKEHVSEEFAQTALLALNKHKEALRKLE